MRAHRSLLATLSAAALGTLVATLVGSMPASAASPAASPTLYPVSAWPLTDAAGSTSARDTVGGRNATIDSKYSGVSFTGATGARFDEHGLLDVAAMSPGMKDFSFGVTVSTTDDDANVFQAGTTTNGVGGDYFAKIEIAGVNHQALSGVARCELTGLVGSSFVHITLAGKSVVADGGSHQITCIKRATSASLMIDGKVVTTRNVSVGTVDLSSKKWTVGGKYTADTGSGDMLNGLLNNAFVNIAH